MAAGYTLAMAVMLLTGGRLGDLFGRKRMLLVGVAGFTVLASQRAAAPSGGADRLPHRSRAPSAPSWCRRSSA